MKNLLLKGTSPLKAKAIRDIRNAIENRNKGIVLTSKNFINFTKNNADKFMHVSEIMSKTVSPSLCDKDRRLTLGGLSLYILCKEFPNDITAPDGSQKGFDALYHNGIKISIKTGTSMFQRNKVYGNGLTKAPGIVLKNGMGHRDIVDPVFDYLLVIQRNYNNKFGRYEYGYGIVDKRTVLQYSSPSEKGDQVISKIPNAAYKYFSGIHHVNGKYSGNEKDDIVKSAEDNLFTTLVAVASLL